MADGFESPVVSLRLDGARSRELLASTAIGRLAVIVDGRPEIFPVAHVYDDLTGCVIFPTWPGTKLAGALEWPWVAFEVDGFAEEEDSGWSVLVVGRAELVVDPDEVARARDRRHVSWRTGRGVHWLRIVPDKVTGREITTVAARRSTR